MAHCVILGCGFTGGRVATLLRAAGHEVVCTSRQSHSDCIFLDVAQRDYAGLRGVLKPETLVLYSIPTLQDREGLWEAAPELVDAISAHPPSRIVYLSTTGVYGPTLEVDESTPVHPQTQREKLRTEAEIAISAGPWSFLILRPAAIYGPGRGIHHSMRLGQFQLNGNGDNYVSRVHVDDLAQITASALLSPLQGFYPVADEEPCTSREAAEFCARLLQVPVPPETSPENLGETRRANRRVNGSAIRNKLGVTLRYPSYREGFPACLEAEALALSTS